MTGVADAQFDYYDGTQWDTTWDSTVTSTLPVAIRFSLSLARSDSAPAGRADPAGRARAGLDHDQPDADRPAAGGRRDPMTAVPATSALGRDRRRGSVLIIVLWICLGLVTLTLYFAHEVNSELQAAANRVGEIEARQAVAGAIRYAAYVLNNYAIDGVVPDSGIPPDPVQDYYSAALQVGDVPGDPAILVHRPRPQRRRPTAAHAAGVQPRRRGLQAELEHGHDGDADESLHDDPADDRRHGRSGLGDRELADPAGPGGLRRRQQPLLHAGSGAGQQRRPLRDDRRASAGLRRHSGHPAGRGHQSQRRPRSQRGRRGPVAAA